MSEGERGQGAAEPFTYSMSAEPARFGIVGSQAGLEGVAAFWLAHVAGRASVQSPDQDAVDSLQRRIVDALAVLRTGHASAADMRIAAEDAIVAALGLGFHHSGGPEQARRIEAELEARQVDRRVAAMNKGRHRPDDVVEFVRRTRDEYALGYPDDANAHSKVARYIIKKADKLLSQGAQVSADFKSYFQTSTDETSKRQDRVRRMMRELDE